MLPGSGVKPIGMPSARDICGTRDICGMKGIPGLIEKYVANILDSPYR